MLQVSAVLYRLSLVSHAVSEQVLIPSTERGRFPGLPGTCPVTVCVSWLRDVMFFPGLTSSGFVVRRPFPELPRAKG